MYGREVTLFAAARRRLGLVLISTVAGVGASITVLAISDTTYTSSTQLYVSVVPEVAADRNVFGSLSFVEGRAATYSSLVDNKSFQDAVAADVGAAEAELEISANVDPDTALLTLNATGPTPQLAQQAAAAATARLEAVALPLDGIVDTDAPPGTPPIAPVRLTVSESPNLPSSPTSPVVPLFLAVGLAGGMGLGLAAASLAARVDDRLRNPDDLGDLADRVGPVFWLPPRRWGGASSGPRREDYRLRLAALHHEFTVLPRSRGAILMLTAPTPSHAASASQVAEDLADTLSEGGRSMALVVMQSRGASRAGPGLSDLLAGTHPVTAVTKHNSSGRVTLGAGTQPLRLSTASDREIAALLGELNQLADVVIIEAPDLSAPAGAAVLATVADAVLVVAARGEARAEELLDARATIERWDASYLGVLLAPRVRTLLGRLPWPHDAPTSTPARRQGRSALAGSSGD
ncbi:hypothetical protein [Pseudonocardia nigra]|uniref:hypothetical protein n=1 Tax=Pseudonocardia nigra TaxID=1921578 RepID=UPI001C5DD3D7|nr:hypothetical protein [Pseudonocardia nigra]